MRARIFSLLLLLLATLTASRGALAWENHTLPTWIALSAMPELNTSGDVPVESLESFLIQEQEGLARALDEDEAWARQNLPQYPARPEVLAFQRSDDPAELRDRFLRAIRISPNSKLPLFLQLLPDQESSRPPLPAEAVTLFPNSENRFVSLMEGESATVIDIIASASDEPDYGLDIGLFEDNGTEFGANYGFGKQPFGNPALEFSSQAPFHMGFYHEAKIVYFMAGFLKQTYPEYRIHLFSSLSRFAFETGHDYWGWRFAGWALHYIGDLTQPYHSTVMPGTSVAKMLWINLLNTIGIHKYQKNKIQLLSNRHLVLEAYVKEKLQTNPDSNPLIAALRDTSGDHTCEVDPVYIRNVLTAESNRDSKITDMIIRRSFPKQWVSDPSYIFGVTEPDIKVLPTFEQQPETIRTMMETLSTDLMVTLGINTRNYVRMTTRRSQ